MRTNRTFIHVLVASTSHETSGTGANGTAIEGVGVTHSTLIAGVTHTSIVKVTQQTCVEVIQKDNYITSFICHYNKGHIRRVTKLNTCLSNRALAEEGSYAVVAGGAVKANGCCTVVDVLAAVVSSPAVNTHAVMAANGVEAGTPIMAGVGLHEALIDVLSAVLS